MKVTTLLKWYIIALCVALLLVLNACRQLSKGKVIDKHFTASYYTFPSKRPVFHEAEYNIKVEGTTAGWETVAEWWPVSSGSYERLKIGDKVDSTVIKYW